MRTRWMLTMGLLAAAMPAAAQQHFQPSTAGPSAEPVYSARVEPYSTVRLSYTRDGKRPPTDAQIFSRRRASSLTEMTSRNDTAFAQEVALPLLSSSRCKFEIGGFFRVRATENMLWGLPGAGTLPAWGVASQSHPGVWAPTPDQSYGLSVKLHFHRGDVVSRNSQSLRCIGKLWAAARSVI
jgi:hypothetical protein